MMYIDYDIHNVLIGEYFCDVIFKVCFPDVYIHTKTFYPHLSIFAFDKEYSKLFECPSYDYNMYEITGAV